MKPYTDCMEVREEFSAYLDGEAGADVRSAIEAHLAICADCLRELDALKRVDVAYSKLQPVPAPESFESQVREAVRVGNAPTTPGRRAIPRWMGPVVAMASAAAVLVVGVAVMNATQPARGPIQVASAPQTMSAPAAAADQGAPADAPAATGGTWDNFARTPAQKDGAWDTLTKKKEIATPRGELKGREDKSDMLAMGLAETAKEKAPAESDGAPASNDLDRAEVVGTPPAAPQAAAPIAPEKIVDAPVLRDESAHERRANPGEVISREVLRSFKVGADGIWYERGYANQPRNPLKRDSASLRELMKSHPEDGWTKLLSHDAQIIFEVDGVWYDLEAAKPETN